MPSLLLYSSLGCHLCEQAQQLCLQVLGEAVPETDIIDDDALYERYGVRIPVLRRQDNGAELDWPFDADDIIRFLQQGESQP